VYYKKGLCMHHYDAEMMQYYMLEPMPIAIRESAALIVVLQPTD